MKAPSVIIGVGGIGSQICSKVEEQLYRMKEQKKGGLLEQENTRFVVIDTDVNSLRELYRHGFRGKRILLTDNMTVAKCRDLLDDPSIDEWYPENTIFSKKSMTEGAGQQRSISRLAFEYCIKDGRLNKLDNVIRELNELTMDDSSQQTRFYVISSLAGGTGSGVILPLAMYLNRFIQGEQGDDLAICKGFFIMSSAFYASCESELEKKSLDANAYAAIKELSAFMRSADDSTASRLSYSLSGYEDYVGSTYEYCYLFGMTNAKAKNIHSFEELKNVVADAVYMQACSPIHDRNSSREDNTIRQTTMLGQENQETWRRRFGGIGCGRLIYPYEELIRYFGLLWAKDMMEQEWRKYDEEYKKERRELRGKRRGKHEIQELAQGTYYIDSVDNADASDWLAARIRKECSIQNGDELWKRYFDAVKEEAGRQVDKMLMASDKNNHWEIFRKNMEGLRDNISGREADRDRYHVKEILVKDWRSLKDELEMWVEELSIDKRLFHIHSLDSYDNLDELPECYLEHWLITGDRQFFHPNSVRYFLYQLERLLEFREQEETDTSNLNSPSIGNEKKLNRKKGKTCYEDFDKLRNDLCVRLKNRMCERYLSQCENYVKKLIRCYEEFYSNYDMILEEFGADIRTIEKKLDRISGVSYSYVCADKMCREKLHEQLGERRSYEEGALSGISYALYNLIHEVNMESGKMATRECSDKIKEFWCEGIQKEEIGKELLDMNILEAMSKEEECRSGRKLTEDGFEEKIRRVQDVLVAPFLQYFQRINMSPGISLCCYHSNLKRMVGVYRNVVEWLDNHNAVDDDSYCSEREILFYRSFVGLEAYEVLDYLHGISAKTAVVGKAFQSYQSVLLNMGKSSGEASRVITPHADKRWNSLHNMPDSSRSYQKEQESYIALALLYAWLSKKIEYVGENKSYTFTLSSDVKNFKSLYDCHLYLYGNLYWYMELYHIMRKEIEDAKRNHVDCYEQIVRAENNDAEKRRAFELFVRYQAELPYGERSNRQKWQMANAVKDLIYECTEGDQKIDRWTKCKQTISKEIDEIITFIDNKTPDVIDEALGNELKSFLNNYRINM